MATLRDQLPVPPAFGRHVLDVVPLCSEEQVKRVAARRVIAMVQHEIPRRDRAIGQFPCQPMHPDWDGGHCTRSENAVAIICFGPRPHPALRSFGAVESIPKARGPVNRIVAQNGGFTSAPQPKVMFSAKPFAVVGKFAIRNGTLPNGIHVESVACLAR